MPPSAPRWPRSPLRTRAAGSGTAVISLPTDLEPALAVARQALQLLRLHLGDAAVAAGDEPVQSRAVTAGAGADRDGRAQQHRLELGPDDGLDELDAGWQVVGIGVVRHRAA